MTKNNSNRPAFTIVELLVVIVVIGILAAITIVAYIGVSNKAIASTLQTDLANSTNRLKMYYVDHGAYPATIDGSNCPTGPVDSQYCLKVSRGNTLNYSSASARTSYILDATSTNAIKYTTASDTAPHVADPNWLTGISGTAMGGKYLLSTDLNATTYQYKTANTNVSSPQGAIGLDPNYPSEMSLVSSNLVDFSVYPARQACKVLGARLPTVQEILSIQTNKVAYGDNFQYSNPYWTSTEDARFGGLDTWIVEFYYGNVMNSNKTDAYYVRCVKNA